MHGRWHRRSWRVEDAHGFVLILSSDSTQRTAMFPVFGGFPPLPHDIKWCEWNVAGRGSVPCLVTQWTVWCYWQSWLFGTYGQTDDCTWRDNCNLIHFNSSSMVAWHKDNSRGKTQQNKQRNKTQRPSIVRNTSKKEDIKIRTKKEWNRNKEWQLIYLKWWKQTMEIFI